MSSMSVSRRVAAYDPSAVEAKWQERWEERRTNVVDLAGAERPYFNLMMFPYPSAEGLHVGNVFAFIGVDIHGRARRLQGWDVFEPLGFDAFGIHSENYALKIDTHPGELIPANIDRFREQLRRIGLMVDWDHELSTTDPRYYRWTQWIFVQLFKAGLAERRRAPVNWCPECKTVLANEQVIDGFCERHPGVKVTTRLLEQWFFKITKYTERLLDHLETVEWSESTRLLQRNWIGPSDGAELTFETATGVEIPVYTTRPDTVFGATYLVLAPEHDLVEEVTGAEQLSAVSDYQRRATQMDVVARRVGSKEKTGVFTGGYARNPATGESIPIWIADYVLTEYGTGAIMAVPGHDERDFDFAQAFGLEVRQVVKPEREGEGARLDELPLTAPDGILINSGQFDGMSCRDGASSIVAWLQERDLAAPQRQYRLHDWCISRQRYWGPPIPVIHCDACGPVPVPEEDLPVELPFIEDFRPDESGVSPLARHEEWFRVPCPKCKENARRETDVSDTFLDSAWYYLRYPSTSFADRPFDKKLTEKWLPVSSYIGGNEHAVLHLMYARFISMVLHDLGFLAFEEPFPRFRAHGTMIKDGAKMSKSRGNVVVPDAYIEKWGADTFRMYLMFLGPYQEGGDFRDEGISGIRRFLDKAWGVVAGTVRSGDTHPNPEAHRKLHQTIQRVTADFEGLRYNTAISALMEYVNTLRVGDTGASGVKPGVPIALVEPLVIMLAPLAPHFAEECWGMLGHDGTVFDASWPTFDVTIAAEDEIELVIQVNGRVRARLRVPRGIAEGDAVERALAEPAVKRFVDPKPIKKKVFVQDRLVNLVV